MIPSPSVLIDGAAEQVHPFTQEPEEAVQDPDASAPDPDLLDDLHRTLHIDEERGDVLALALEVRAMEQLGDDMVRGVRLGIERGELGPGPGGREPSSAPSECHIRPQKQFSCGCAIPHDGTP